MKFSIFLIPLFLTLVNAQERPERPENELTDIQKQIAGLRTSDDTTKFIAENEDVFSKLNDSTRKKVEDSFKNTTILNTPTPTSTLTSNNTSSLISSAQESKYFSYLSIMFLFNLF